MPRKSAKSPVPPSVRSRRSAGASEFLSLDLYSKNGKVGEVINVFKADENHNGIKVESVIKKSPATPSSAAAAPKKRVRVKSEVVSPPGTTPVKRSKRDSSVASSVVTQSSSVVVVVTPKRGRGRPKGTGKAAAAGSKTPVKTPKRERVSSVETQSSSVVVVAAPKRGRPKGTGKAGAAGAGKSVSMPPLATGGGMARKSAAGRTPARQPPQPKKKAVVKQELPPTDDEEMEEEEEQAPANDHDDDVIMDSSGQDGAEIRDVKPDPRTIRSMRGPATTPAGVKKRLQSAIDELAHMNNSQLPFARHKALVLRLMEVANCATTMTAADYDNVMDNLMVAENYIKSGGTPPPPSDSAALEDKIASLEAEKTALLEDKGKLDKRLADRQKEIEVAMKTVEETRGEKDAMREELQAIKDRLDAVAPGRHSRAASSSSSRTTTRSEAPGVSVARLPAYNNNNNMPAIRPATCPPMFDPQCMQGMPSGSAIGHTTMAGRAAEVIAGIGHVTGLEDAYASVAVTAATVPEMDQWGNIVQRTIRTTVERIAVTDGMNVAQLQALGYEISGYTGGSDDEEDDEAEEQQRNGRGARIEEMNAGYNDFGSEENGGGAGPLIEEVE